MTFTAEATDVDLKLHKWAEGETFQDTSSIEKEVEGTIKSYEWDFGDDNTATTEGGETSHTYEQGGTYNASVTVKCDDDESATANPAATVKPNTPPTVSITSPSEDEKFTVGDQIECTGTATDAEDGDLTSQIQWDPSSSVDTSGMHPGLFGVEVGGPVLLASFFGEDVGGSYTATVDYLDQVITITATVTDSVGKSTSDSVDALLVVADSAYTWVAGPKATINGSGKTVSITFEAPGIWGYDSDVTVTVRSGGDTESDTITVKIAVVIIL